MVKENALCQVYRNLLHVKFHGQLPPHSKFHLSTSVVDVSTLNSLVIRLKIEVISVIVPTEEETSC